MKPGRELDVIVAEKVMGLKDVRKITDPMAQGAFGDILYSAEKPDPYPDNAGIWLGHLTRVPSYSTDIAAAFEVWDKLNNKRWALEKCLDDRWSVFVELQYEGRVSIATGESAPHAICLAALKAVGAY